MEWKNKLRQRWSDLKRWWYFVNRYTWAADLRCKCEGALRSALKAEDQIKLAFKDAVHREADFRELERDHKILIARSRKLERMVQSDREFDFNFIREDIQNKAKEVREKFVKLTDELRG